MYAPFVYEIPVSITDMVVRLCLLLVNGYTRPEVNFCSHIKNVGKEIENKADSCTNRYLVTIAQISGCLSGDAYRYLIPFGFYIKSL